jgi:Fe2+ or Zn2+ uptake regulation protein
VATEEALTRYESNVGPHHHFVCRACGRLEDVPSELFATPPAIELEGGHEVESFEVVLRGVCGACRRKG